MTRPRAEELRRDEDEGPAPAQAVRERVDLGREVAAQRRVGPRDDEPRAAPAQLPPDLAVARHGRRLVEGARVRQQVEARLVRPQLPAQVGPVRPDGHAVHRLRARGVVVDDRQAGRRLRRQRRAERLRGRDGGGERRRRPRQLVGGRRPGEEARDRRPVAVRGAARGGRGHRLRGDAHRREVQPAAGRGVPDEREVLGEVPQRRRRGLEGQPRGVRPEAPRPAPREHRRRRPGPVEQRQQLLQVAAQRLREREPLGGALRVRRDQRLVHELGARAGARRAQPRKPRGDGVEDGRRAPDGGLVAPQEHRQAPGGRPSGPPDTGASR